MTPQDHIREAQAHLDEARRLLALEAAGVEKWDGTIRAKTDPLPAQSVLMKKCPDCGGCGWRWNRAWGMYPCKRCDGTGQVVGDDT